MLLCSFPTDDYISLQMRFTWPNILSFVTIFWEIIQLLCLLFYVFNIQRNNNFNLNIPENDYIFKFFVQSSKWFLFSHQNINNCKVKFI